MNKYKYILEPYKGRNTRYDCPACRKSNVFARYIDSDTNEYIHYSVGRCNREEKCGYHYSPSQYFNDNNISVKPNTQVSSSRKHVQSEIKPISTIPADIFVRSLQAYNKNSFASFLYQQFGKVVGDQLVARYHIGTSGHWDGATVFWQITVDEKIRTGKVLLYNALTGKRVKQPYTHINWVHSILKIKDYNLQQCFFGEHLLVDRTRPVAIVESEKSAVIASAYLPDFVWLAAGSLSNLRPKRCAALKGRDVVLFPDLNAFDKWNEIAGQLSMAASCTVSDLLENNANASEKAEGLDLADYLLKFDLLDFLKPENNDGQVQHEADDNTVPELKFESGDATIGQVMDYYKAKGYKELPAHVQINAENWAGRLSEHEIIINQIKRNQDETN